MKIMITNNIFYIHKTKENPKKKRQCLWCLLHLQEIYFPRDLFDSLCVELLTQLEDVYLFRSSRLFKLKK